MKTLTFVASAFVLLLLAVGVTALDHVAMASASHHEALGYSQSHSLIDRLGREDHNPTLFADRDDHETDHGEHHGGYFSDHRRNWDREYEWQRACEIGRVWVPGHVNRYGLWVAGHYQRRHWVSGHWNRFGRWVSGHCG